MGLYHGLKTGSIENTYLRLEFLLEGALRIVRLVGPGSPDNFLAETPDYGWETPLGWYHLWGGHRLWLAPQHLTQPDVPETQAIRVEAWEGGVRLLQDGVEGTGIAKSIEVLLESGRAAAIVLHRIENRGAQPLECAPWAITQVPTGGRIYIPLADPPVESKGAGPNRYLVFWPYNRLPDPRLEIHNRYLAFDARPMDNEFKLGTHTPHGWVGYARRGYFYRKRFLPIAGAAYPDLGSSIEIYCNHHFAEIETLGPLTTLHPGEAVEHTELWEVFPLDNAREMLPDDQQ
jgi:hypothetical protein